MWAVNCKLRTENCTLSSLAQMGVASFCAGVRDKRYNGQLETAPYIKYYFRDCSIVMKESRTQLCEGREMRCRDALLRLYEMIV